MWIDDQILAQCDRRLVTAVWVPEQAMVVLGSSNRAELEVDEAVCQDSGVQVLKRCGGGGTVVLYPGVVVASVGTWVAQRYQNQTYFHLLNEALSTALTQMDSGLEGLSQDGVSDICWQGRKVVGTSLFRSRNYVLYQASVICHAHRELMESLLRYPTKEPEYRGGRSHSDFVVGLDEISSRVTAKGVAAALTGSLGPAVERSLGDHGIDPVVEQVLHVQKRAAK